MPIFQLGSHPIKALDMSVGQETCQIERETEKAYLFRRIKEFPDSVVDEAFWFPKSQCRIKARPIEYAGPGVEICQDYLHIPEWLWEARKPAQPMGARQ